MIWLSRICSSRCGARFSVQRRHSCRRQPTAARMPLLHAKACATLILLAAGLPLAGASVSGKVDLRDSKDSTVSKKKDYSGVIVWLDSATGPVPPLHVDARAIMVQKGKAFTPHVLAVRTGTTVDFPNFDPIFHNAF